MRLWSACGIQTASDPLLRKMFAVTWGRNVDWIRRPGRFGGHAVRDDDVVLDGRRGRVFNDDAGAGAVVNPGGHDRASGGSAKLDARIERVGHFDA